MAQMNLMGVSVLNYKSLEEFTLGQTTFDSAASPLSRFNAIKGGANTGKSNVISALRLLVDLHDCDRVELPPTLSVDSMIDNTKPMVFEAAFEIVTTDNTGAPVTLQYAYRVVYNYDTSINALVKTYEVLFQTNGATASPGAEIIMLVIPGRGLIKHRDHATYPVVDATFANFDPVATMNSGVSGSALIDSLQSITAANHFNQIINGDDGYYHLKDFMTGIGFICLKPGVGSQQRAFGKLHRHVNTDATNLLAVMLYLIREHKGSWDTAQAELRTQLDGFSSVEYKTIHFETGFPRALEMVINEEWPVAGSDPVKYQNSILSNGTVARMAYKMIVHDPNPLRVWIIDIMETNLVDDSASLDTAIDVIDELKTWITGLVGTVIATTNLTDIAAEADASFELTRDATGYTTLV